MKDDKIFIYNDDDFESYKYKDLGILNIKSNVYEIVTDLPESSNFIEAIQIFESDHSINGIIIFNEGNSLGTAEYERYISSVFSHSGDDEKWTDLELSNRTTRTRELVILNKVIKKIIHSPKIVISSLQGEVVTPFIGASLACDIRFVSENTVFVFSHSKMNIHPSGALPYFLPKYVGHGTAANILYGKYTLSPEEAKKLGIVREIIPEEKFFETVIEKSQEIIGKGLNAFVCTKKLFNAGFSDLEKYLNLEECDFKQK
jgi:enoyl-CoA hydratase/carnithine racemase